jgi:hypothetical protein
MDHVISADESETIEVKNKAMDWAGEITDLFPQGNKEAIHQAVQGLRTRYNGKLAPPSSWTKWISFKPLIHIGLSLLRLP